MARKSKPLHMYQPGDVVADRYGVQGLIAAGGMAEVYEVIDAETGSRRALRTANARYALDEKMVARMVREAQALRTIDHKHLVKVYDAGVDQGQFFMVMELLDGVTLKQLALERKLPLGVILTLMLQAAIALHPIHLLGHVHRDVKPDNLMVVKDERGELRLVVIDFGIAKIAGHSTTTDGKTLGTAAYIAPEQAKGEEVDGRTDLYALGTIMYLLIAGVHGLQGDSLPASPQEWMQRHIDMKPEPLDRMVRGLHPAVTNLVMRAIAKEAEHRFPSMLAFAEQIGAIIELLRNSGQLGPTNLATLEREPPAGLESGPQPVVTPEAEARRVSRMAYAVTHPAGAPEPPPPVPAPLPPLPMKPEPPRVAADVAAARAERGTLPMRGRQGTLPHLGGPAPSPAPPVAGPVPPAPPPPATAAVLSSLVAEPAPANKWLPAPAPTPLPAMKPEAEAALSAEVAEKPLPRKAVVPKWQPEAVRAQEPGQNKEPARPKRRRQAEDEGWTLRVWLKAFALASGLSLISLAVVAAIALRWNRESPTAPVTAAPTATLPPAEAAAASAPEAVVQPASASASSASASASEKPLKGKLPPPKLAPAATAPRTASTAPAPSSPAVDLPFKQPKPSSSGLEMPFSRPNATGKPSSSAAKPHGAWEPLDN